MRRTNGGRSCGVFAFAFALLCLLAVNPPALYSQSATSGLVTGVITDQSKAVVPDASVTLEQKGTGSKQATASDSSGRYVFPNIEPGDYTLKVTAKGFKAFAINDLKVAVLQSYTVNASLELGETTVTVYVETTPEAELQTTDASLGTVLGGEGMQRLPAFTRSASSLMFFQPGVSPSPAVAPGLVASDTTGGQVTGSRSEQITFNLDGGDATSDLEGSNSYISPPGEPQPAPIVPVPADSTEEFRVSTSNSNSTLGRSSGGQVALLTKHGTDSFHGSAYEYHSDDGEQANTWTNNIASIHKPHQVDNRFGFTTGGPIWKNKVFFFVNYEGRRFHDSSTFTNVVPTATLKSGILQSPICSTNTFDASGNCTGKVTTQSFNLNPANGALSAACNAGACDPRAKGASPVTLADLALFPAGNFNGLGDGLNTTGLAFAVPTPISANIAVTRLDYKINSKWNLFGTWHWAKVDRIGSEQIQIAPGTPKSVSGDPFEPNLYTVSLTGQLTPSLTMVTHGSFLRNWWAWNRLAPAPQVPGTTQALELAGEGLGTSNSLAKLLSDPYNINTQQARGRFWNGHNWYIAQDYSWVRGKHVLQFGASGYIWNDTHLRTDDVLGGLTSGPALYLQSTSAALFGGNAANLNIPAAFEPVGINTANGDSVRYDQLYSVLLGLVDRSAQVATRNGSFQPNPLGTPLIDNVHIPSFYTYFQDVFQVRPGLTVTAGLNWGVQLSPTEAGGKEVVYTYAGTNAPINFQQYLQNRAAALSQGIILNPQYSLTPSNFLSTPLKGTMRQTTWNDIGPRISVAWTVPWKNKVFGDKQTVIRGGYGLIYDRSSAVGQVLNPLLTGGLADVAQCAGPTFATGGGVKSCNGPGTDPTNAFRIGVDGNTVPVPPTAALPIPFSPGTFGLFLTAPLDPYAKPAHIHNIDFTVQRALPGRMFLELGYIGRFSRNLPEAVALNAPYYLTRDPKSGQTLAQAFDGIATQLRAGVKPTLAGGAPNPAFKVQPFFEDIGQSVASSGCQAAEGAPGSIVAVGSPCTIYLAANAGGSAIAADLGGFMQTFDLSMATPLDDTQALLFTGVTDHSFSNYNAGFIALNKAFSNNLQMQFNWTYAHAIGNQGLNQQNDYSPSSPYNYNIDKSSEQFDRKHTVNLWWYYTLPFGRGTKHSFNSSFVNRVVGGWYTSGIFTYATGLPEFIGADGDYGACCGLSSGIGISGMAALSSLNLRGQETLNNNGPACIGGAAPGGVGACGFPNLFGNPQAVFNSLSRPLLSQVTQQAYDQLRLLPIWNIDLSVGKNIIATERFKVILSGDFFNIVNHPLLGTASTFGSSGANYSLDMSSPSTFGTIFAQDNTPRKILIGLRFEF